MPAPRQPAPGPVLFARYAFPPNSHGFCGPADHAGFFGYGVAALVPELRAMAQQFAGAWPYLQLIAAATGLADPLDRRVVEAYWVGSPRLDKVGTRAVGDSMEERFRRLTGAAGFGSLTEGVLAGGVPHHSFAVFCIYPYTGLLTDARKAPHALMVLDRCRIRWGRVLAADGDRVVVESRPLTWDGRELRLGPGQPETAIRSLDGVGMVGALEPGDWVSLHWEWVCDRLTQRQVAMLHSYTDRHLRIVNDRATRSAVPRILG